jgi:hypothetical protein
LCNAGDPMGPEGHQWRKGHLFEAIGERSEQQALSIAKLVRVDLRRMHEPVRPVPS